MVKIRLKRLGYKKNPTYRIVVINSRDKREGAPIEELGYYNPKTKEMKLDKAKANDWITKGAQATDTVKYLLANCKEDGTLDYKKSETVKLSKKAQAKLEAEQAAAAEAAAAEAVEEAPESAEA
ncbi:30S ribosomal protein S16 [bacterium]|nr:30S ribosomal protein S16 [bacterium]